jgi:hypothetical protein
MSEAALSSKGQERKQKEGLKWKPWAMEVWKIRKRRVTKRPCLYLVWTKNSRIPSKKMEAGCLVVEIRSSR